MNKLRLSLLAIASLSVVSISSATTIVEDFSSDPLQSGWKVFGDANLFQWSTTHQHLAVTWDSSKTNSYFHRPIGTILTRDDDFSIHFDLMLHDIVSDTEPGKTGSMQIALGFQNFAGATSGGFMRGAFGGAPNVVEFNYFASGYYDFGGIFPVNPTTTPAFIARSGFSYAPSAFTPYEFEIPTNVLVHVAMEFSSSSQTLVMSLSTNGILMRQLPDLVLTNGAASGFNPSDDFRVDAFSISSYSSFGNDYDSVLAHGYVDNLHVTVPSAPVRHFTGTISNGLWRVQFENRTNWVYTLERTEDFQSWTAATLPALGNGSLLTLTDTNSVVVQSFYRVRASRP